MKEFIAAQNLLNAGKVGDAFVAFNSLDMIALQNQGMDMVAYLCSLGTNAPEQTLDRMRDTAAEIHDHMTDQNHIYTKGAIEALVQITISLEDSYIRDGELRYPCVIDMNGRNNDLGEALNIATIAATRVASKTIDMEVLFA